MKHSPAVHYKVQRIVTKLTTFRRRSGAVEGARQHADTAALAPKLRLPSGAVIRFRVRATVSVGDTGATTSLVCEGTFETAPAAPAFPGPAKWIGGGGQLHATALTLPPGTVAHARAYASGVGAFYLYLNGEQREFFLPFIDVLCDHCQVEDVEVRNPTSRRSALPSPRES